MLLQYLHDTSKIPDRFISGEPPKSIKQQMDELKSLVKELGHLLPKEVIQESYDMILD
jgi:hypothetical protein